jgi:hypothetical protein
LPNLKIKNVQVKDSFVAEQQLSKTQWRRAEDDRGRTDDDRERVEQGTEVGANRRQIGKSGNQAKNKRNAKNSG